MSNVRIKQLTISGKDVRHNQDRLVFNNSGLAYYDEINSSINNLSGDFNSRLTQSGISLTSLNSTTSGALNTALGNLDNRLTDTGIYFTNLVNEASGALDDKINAASAGVASINGLSGQLSISSATPNIGIINSGQTIWISGIYVADKVQINAGSDNYSIPFSVPFASVPKVSATLELTGSFVDIVPFSVYNITTSNYSIRFADTLTDGYYIQSIATL
jgi:hypothetical protein